MSGVTAMGVLASAAVAGVAMQYQQGKEAQSAQRDAATQATAAATKTADQADQAMNMANAKQPDIAASSSANSLAAKGGVGGTMLTGPQGAAVGNALLGKTTLLGG